MIGREAPLAELTRAAGLCTDVYESPAPLVIVYGGASTGKSVGVSMTLQKHPSPHTLVDCTALYSAKEFYQEALAQLHNGATVAENNEVVVSMDVPGRDEVADESGKAPHDEKSISSLNFLAFFKTLDKFMAHNASKGPEQSRRVLYLALDHVDKLLDRGFGALITCVCTMNDQIAYLHVRLAALLRPSYSLTLCFVFIWHRCLTIHRRGKSVCC